MTKVKTIVGSNNFDIQELNNFANDIFSYFSIPGYELVITEKNTFLNNKEFANYNSYKHVGTTPRKNHIVLAKSDKGKLNLFDFTAQKELSINIDSEMVLTYNNTIYSKIDGNIVEINFIETGSNITVTSKVVCQTMKTATKFFDGVAFQNMLKAFYVVIFPKPGIVYQVNIKELQSYVKILDAKFDNNVLFIVAIDAKGKTDQLILRFDSTHETYDLRKHENISFTGINFTTLENGICVCINPSDQLELFSNTIGSQNIKIIDDPVISSDMKLFKNGTKVLFANGPKIYSIKTK
jgi:hypothetical protein